MALSTRLQQTLIYVYRSYRNGNMRYLMLPYCTRGRHTFKYTYTNHCGPIKRSNVTGSEVLPQATCIEHCTNDNAVHYELIDVLGIEQYNKPCRHTSTISLSMNV